MSVCAYLLSAVSTRCRRKTHMNGLKKCLCMRSTALLFTQCKRKTHENGLKKFLLSSCGDIKYTADDVEDLNQIQ